MPARIAAEWLERLAGCDLSRVEAGELDQVVTAVAERLNAALGGEFPDLEEIRRGAEDLVAAGATDPAIVSRSVPFLRDLAERAGHGAADRVDAIVGTFGEGFARAAVEAAEVRYEGLEAAFRTAPIAISIGSIEGRIDEVNPAFEQLTGFRAADLRGVLGYRLVPSDRRAEVQDQVRAAVEAGVFTSEGPIPQADGTEIFTAWTVVPAVSRSGRHHYMLGFGEDITERHNATEQLKWQALHDPLTSVANRRHLLERLAETAAAAGPQDVTGVCALDMDDFKPVNDSHGHLIGDQLLVEVAQRMQAAIADPDCFLARVGGDEFVAVVAPPTDVDRLHAVVSGLQAAVLEPFLIGGHRIDVTVSVGAVLGPVDAHDPIAVLDAADRALYEAKTQGTNRLVLRRFFAGGDLSQEP